MSPTSERAARYEAQLREAGLRMTKQRLAIVQVLAETNDHPDANEIFYRAFSKDPSISLSTVYRTMRILEQSGTIHRHAFDDGRARFEHAGQEHHDHLIDIETGKVIEFRSDKIEQLQAEIARELGYDIVRHKLELYGVASKAKSQTRTVRLSRPDEAKNIEPRRRRGHRKSRHRL
jgi:Fur family ferric uptake transcriptional regulator